MKTVRIVWSLLLELEVKNNTQILPKIREPNETFILRIIFDFARVSCCG